MPLEPANQAQRSNWNENQGRKWIRYETLLEASIAPAAALLLAEAAPRTGERVLEVGCGAGTLLGRIQAAVGPQGRLTGVDISSTMLAAAAARVPDRVELIEADAQTAALGGPYDLILSRFGVMFFDDPVAAFANLRSALAAPGRMSFVYWAALEQNLQWLIPLCIAERYVGVSERSDPNAPGPMALADADRVQKLLLEAGFGDVALHTTSFPFVVDSPETGAELSVRMGPAGALITERNADEATIDAIRNEITRNWSSFNATVHVVTAMP